MEVCLVTTALCPKCSYHFHVSEQTQKKGEVKLNKKLMHNSSLIMQRENCIRFVFEDFL